MMWTDIQEFLVMLAPLGLIVGGVTLATLLIISLIAVFVAVFDRQ